VLTVVVPSTVSILEQTSFIYAA